MEEINSVLIFKKYIVNKVIFEKNENYNFKDGEKIHFKVKDEVKKEKNKMEVKLIVNIFENSKVNNYPFEMEVQVTGFFEIENDKENIDFIPNAIAILYPYIRAIVSTYTASSNVNSLILPTINVNAMLEKQKESNKKN